MKNNLTLLQKYSTELGIALLDNQIKQFTQYQELLLQWNNKMNLISKKDESKIEIHHFLDSLAASKFIPQNGKGIDIGSGGGFPAIPLKIAMPQLKYSLIESIGKKALFLDTVIRKLNLTQITTIQERAETFLTHLSPNQKYDFATARAVADLEKLIELCLPFLKKDAILYAYKSKDVEEEIYNATTSKKQNNFTILDVISYKLPTTNIIRKIVLVQKI